MALTPATRLGPFEIVALLGAGGMGEVYRAKDTTLNREVAIKVLPPRVAEDPERLARFKREAMVLASLNHPNIAAIYGLETRETVFLVLELVEGEDLAQRLTRGAIPLEEALGIATQIATALEEAHEKGIVHRDLKPANVMLTPQGKVKVLDFGLAKAYASDSSGSGSSDSADSPTMTHAATTAGMILGTAAYMSPEQARGTSVDRRTDIWAFGAVVFEMLTGRALFKGETATDIVAAVMRDDIDWSVLPAGTPDSVKHLLARCLDRDVKRRLQAIGEARVTLDEATRSARSSSPRAHRGRWLGAGVLVLVSAVAFVLWSRGRTGHDLPAPAASPGTRSIAVLPFVNSSGSSDDEYLADGMTDELIAGLGKVPGLRVAARSSAFTFKGQKVEVREVSQKLGVDTVLEGTIRRSGKRLRVTASLVNAADGLQLWSSTFENDGGDAFAVQDQVTHGVVSGLSLQLRGAALDASQAGRTKDPEAHDLYLRGLAAANASNEADLRRALELYHQAIERDPDFALPYVGIAWVHTFLADAYVPPMEAYPKALAAAQAALTRDDRIADAHALLAFSMFSLSWGDAATVEREFARALELDPNSVNSRFMFAAYRCFYGPPETAFGDVDRTAQLDPLSPLAPMLREFCNYTVGRYDAVIEAHRVAESIDPSFIYFQSWAAAAYRELGDYPSALREYASAAKSLNGAPQYGLALTYLRMGRTKDAADIMRSMDERARSRYVPFFARALLHAALGDPDTGVELLQKAVDGREQMFLALRNQPEMAPLFKDPRARAILGRVEALRQSSGR